MIATVILIGFAVSIGAVVMSWGKTAFQKVEEKKNQDETGNLAWYLGSNIENVCYNDNAISLRVKGTPKLNIKSIFVAAKGQGDFIATDKIEIPQSEQDIIDVKVPYDKNKYGEISELILGAVDTALITNSPARCG